MMRSMDPTTPVAPLGRRLLQWSLDGILFFLVVFTPLAFGSVEHWGVAIIAWSAVLTLLLWAILVWKDEVAGGTGSLPARILASVRSAGAGVALVAFLGVVLVQLLPLPPVLIGLVSPTTLRVYETTLPHFGSGKEVDFNRMEQWLLQSSASDPAQEADVPWRSEESPQLRFSGWRPLSLVPSTTRRSAVLFLAYLILFIIVVDRARSPVFVRRFLWAVGFTGLLVGVLGLAQRTTWGDLLYGRVRPAYGGQPMGPFVNPNHFAGYLELTLPVLLGLWIAHVRSEGGTAVGHRHRASAAERLGQKYIPQLFVLSMMLLVGGLAFWGSRSRGGLAAMTLAVGVFALPALRRWGGGSALKKAAVLGVLLVLAVAVVWKVDQLSGEESLESGLTSEPSLGKRFEVWKTSAAMLLRFPSVGTGLGTFGFVIPLYQGSGYDRLWIYAHNDYLQLACEVGLLGLACFLVGFAAFSVRVLGPFLRAPLERGGAALGCALGMTSLLFHELVDFNLQIPSNGLLFVLLGGVLAAGVAGGARTPVAENPPQGRTGAAPKRSLLFRMLFVAGCVAVSAMIGVHVAARTLQGRATEQFWSGKLEESRRNLQRAMGLTPSLPDLQADFGFLNLRSFEGWDGPDRHPGSDRQEALQSARVAFCRAINLNPVNTFFWSGLAEVYRYANVAGLLEKARDLTSLLEASPGTGTEERLYLAAVRRMMKLEPNNPYHYSRLGDFFWETGNRQGALSAYGTAVRMLPKVEEHSFLGAQEVPSEVLQAAIHAIEAALSENRSGVPDHEIHLNASLLYEKAGNLRAAVTHMERAQELLPRKEWYGLRLGYLYFSFGDLDRSRLLLAKAVNLGVRSEYPYVLLASIARKKGEPEVALENYRKALGVNPENGRVAIDLAAVYEEMGDQRNATRYYDLAVELMPGDVATLSSVVDFYTRNGMVARSIPILEKIVTLRPHEDVYRERLQQFRARVGLLR